MAVSLSFSNRLFLRLFVVFVSLSLVSLVSSQDIIDRLADSDRFEFDNAFSSASLIDSPLVFPASVPSSVMPVLHSPTADLPLTLSQLEQYALAASTHERVNLLSHHVDPNSDDWHYLQLLAWQTADMQHFQPAMDADKKPPNTATLHCSSKAYTDLLAVYRQRFPHSTQLRTIQLRHDLLTFLTSSNETVQQVIQRICDDYAHVDFNHAPHSADDSHTSADDEEKHDFPTRLDPALVQLSTVLAEPFKDGSGFGNAFSSFPLAIDWMARWYYSAVVVKKPKDEDHVMRNALGRFLESLNSPTIPHLVDLVLYDMHANSLQFGNRGVHAMLCLSDLVQLAKRWSDIELQQPYVHARLERMVPDDGLEGLTVQQKIAFYDEQVAYVLKLSDAQLDVKANTIFHALAYKLSQGIYDEQLFYKHYFALPLPAPLIQPKASNSTPMVNLRNGRGELFPPVQDRHSELAAEYVRHFFAQQKASDRLDVDDSTAIDRLSGKRLLRGWLQEQCAIAQLQEHEDLSATAKEKFVGWLRGSSHNARNSVLLSFVPSTFSSNTPPAFTATEEMKLTMTLKNVGTSLLVKLYRVASTTFYRLQSEEINVATFNLDGVVAHHEETVQLPAYSSYHRFHHTLDVQSFLTSPFEHGVFILEVTAQGKKVRALLRRGALTMLSEVVPAGVVLKVFNTDMAVTAHNTRVYVGGQEYVAGADGLIVLPYSPQPRHNEAIVLSASDDKSNEYSSLTRFQYMSEQYSLGAAVHVDMETLLAGSQSEIVVHATMALNERPLPLSQLQRVKLHIRTVHGDDVSSTQVIDDVRLEDAGELVHPFTVPSRLRSIHVTLEGEMPRHSVNDVQKVSASTDITVSTLIAEDDGGDPDDDSLKESLDDLYLRYGSDGYGVVVLGKAGEAIARRPVHVILEHRYLSEPFDFHTADRWERLGCAG